MHNILPQLALLALLVLGLGVELANDGKPKVGKYNFWTAVIADVIVIVILLWGGFFNVLLGR